MQIVIDGYNLIKQLFNVSKVSEKKRDAYVRELATQTQAKGHTLIIVFDGGSYGFPTKESHNGCTVMYSGYKESADDVIKQYVSDNRHLELLVVTSDREIRDFVHNLGVDTLDSPSFSKLLSQETTEGPQQMSIAPNARSTKTSTQDDPELDALMSQVSDAMEKDDAPKASRDSNARKQSKKDKKLHKKLSKL